MSSVSEVQAVTSGVERFSATGHRHIRCIPWPHHLHGNTLRLDFTGIRFGGSLMMGHRATLFGYPILCALEHLEDEIGAPVGLPQLGHDEHTDLEFLACKTAN